MKPSRFVWMFWLANLLLLASVAAFMWHENSTTRAERATRDASIADTRTDQPRIEWKPDTVRPTFAVGDTRLSPIERPKPKPVIVPPPPQVKIEKTDEQLRTELEAALNKRFKLLRMVLSSNGEYRDTAIVAAGVSSLQWFEGMSLKDEYGTSKSGNLRMLAYDMVVLSIDDEGVRVDAASLEKPEKRFEILLRISEEPVMFSPHFLPEDKAPRRAPKNDGEPKLPVPDPAEREQEFSKDDYKDEVIQDFAKYTRATENGLEILADLPEESPARKYGARGGEVVKTINGEAVKSMSDVRRIVRTLYDGGTREFIVGYERDGVPGERTFKAPETK